MRNELDLVLLLLWYLTHHIRHVQLLAASWVMIVRLLHLCDNLMGCSLVLRIQDSTLTIQLSHLGSQRSEKYCLDQLSPKLYPPIIDDEVSGLTPIRLHKSIDNPIAVSTRHIVLNLLFHQINWLTRCFRRFEVESLLLELLDQRVERDLLRAIYLLLEVPDVEILLIAAAAGWELIVDRC